MKKNTLLEKTVQAFLVFLSAIRIHHWVKNILVFIPMLAAHQFNDSHILRGGVCAFFAFSFCASSVYLLNDVMDRPSDRQHPVKRRRALASEKLTLNAALVLTLFFLALGLGLSTLVALQFTFVLVAYWLLTLFYTLG